MEIGDGGAGGESRNGPRMASRGWGMGLARLMGMVDGPEMAGTGSE